MGRSPRGHPLRVLGGLTCEEGRVAALWPGRCFWLWGMAVPVNPGSRGLWGLVARMIQMLCVVRPRQFPPHWAVEGQGSMGRWPSPKRRAGPRLLGNVPELPGPLEGLFHPLFLSFPPI